MAYIGPTVDGGQYYNTNYAVGGNASNRRDDVMLVQWMLHHIYTDHPFLSPPENKPMIIDGWIGPQTIRWITAFQNEMRRRGIPCFVDGRVDSARKPVGAVSKMTYTILLMNGIFQVANPTVYSDPSMDPVMPQELRVALATNTSAAGPFEEQQIAIPASGGI